jgi:hypothetical protein
MISNTSQYFCILYYGMDLNMDHIYVKDSYLNSCRNIICLFLATGLSFIWTYAFIILRKRFRSCPDRLANSARVPGDLSLHWWYRYRISCGQQGRVKQCNIMKFLPTVKVMFQQFNDPTEILYIDFVQSWYEL